VFYINLNIIIFITLNKRKFLWWFISCFIIALTFSFIKYLESFYVYNVIDLVITIKGKPIENGEFWTNMISYFLTNGFFIFISTVYKFAVDWFFNEKEKTELEKQSLSAELAFLKSQINPHFLFNSLNNIYSLAYHKSDETPNAILK